MAPIAVAGRGRRSATGAAGGARPVSGRRTRRPVASHGVDGGVAVGVAAGGHDLGAVAAEVGHDLDLRQDAGRVDDALHVVAALEADVDRVVRAEAQAGRAHAVGDHGDDVLELEQVRVRVPAGAHDVRAGGGAVRDEGDLVAAAHPLRRGVDEHGLARGVGAGAGVGQQAAEAGAQRRGRRDAEGARSGRAWCRRAASCGRSRRCGRRPTCGRRGRRARRREMWSPSPYSEEPAAEAGSPVRARRARAVPNAVPIRGSARDVRGCNMGSRP